MLVPDLPPGQVRLLPGRGEIFYRHHQGPPGAPTLLLLHGWTASADLQWFTALPALLDGYSVIAVDHRGHGRGIRAAETFTLEDCADDAAALVHALRVGPVIAVGYSMGGPITLHLWRRHPELVAGVVLEATAMEWRATRAERLRWLVGLRLTTTLFASRATRRLGRRMMARLVESNPAVSRYLDWIDVEFRRDDPAVLTQAGLALSSYDARPWAHRVDVPAGVLITTQDRLVPPYKQRALADALRAEVLEIAADHACPYARPAEFARLTRQLVDRVALRAEVARAHPIAG